MARSRNIKPGFFKNEVLAEMPVESRLLFIGLWTLADREGRLEDRPRRIKMELFAFDGFDVDSMLTQLQSNKFLTRYEVDGSRFIQIENFVKHQDPHYKEKASEIPPPPGAQNLILATGVTRTQRVRILERDNYTCQRCASQEHLCIDHVLPVSRGGDSSDENLQVLCLSCNTSKGNKLDGESKNFSPKGGVLPPVDSGGNFGSTSVQRRINTSASCPLIPDSLIPSSLIPDSGFTDSLIPEQKKVAAPRPSAAPPTAPQPFDGMNAEALNGKSVVTLAPHWELPDDWGEDAEALGWKPGEVLRESEKFRQYWVAGKGSGTRRSVKGWRQTWSNWLDKAAKDKR